jgi:chitinase
MALPTKVQSGYYMMWSNSPQIRLKDIPAQVNVVNLSFIQGTRLVGWGPYGKATTIADAKVLRARGVRVIASVGGAGGSVNLADRQGFVNAVKSIAAELPLDGIDWDVEDGAFNSADVVAISTQLKRDFGAKFAITMAPNGSNVGNYLNIAVQLQKAGALDMYGQQFYDAPVSKEAAKGRVDQAIAAGVPQSKIPIGMMIGSTSNYWTVDACVTNVKFIKASYPGIRGGYLWQLGNVGTADWANRMASLLKG